MICGAKDKGQKARSAAVIVLLLLTEFIASGQVPEKSAIDQPQVDSLNGQPRVFSRGIVPAESEKSVALEPKHESPPTPPSVPPTKPVTQFSEVPGQPSSAQLGQVARHAWMYLQATQSRETGLFDSVAGYHHATMWDIASSLAALVAAEKLGTISHEDFLVRTERVLDCLRRMPFYNHELPNREYEIGGLTMLDSHSRPSSRGSGWSTTDLGRLLIWLKIIEQWYPELGDRVRQIVSRWKFTRLARHGEAYGALLKGRREFLRQEGRLGYEQYAASGFALWGTNLGKALQFSSTESFQLYATQLQRDIRNMAYLTSEPFFLARMEIGPVNPQFDLLEQSLYAVQRKRWEASGVLTAVSEDAISQQPWFVYNTISAGRVPWACVSPSGLHYPQFKSISTKAAFALWSVHTDSYGLRLFAAVEGLFHPERGYYAGVFDSGSKNSSLNINTNAIILEAILYYQLGRRPFLQISQLDLANATSRFGVEAAPKKE